MKNKQNKKNKNAVRKKVAAKDAIENIIDHEKDAHLIKIRLKYNFNISTKLNQVYYKLLYIIYL